MDVNIAGMQESLPIGVVKADDTVFFKATKGNKQLQRILNRSIGHKEYYRNNMACTTVMDSITQLRDEKYKDHLKLAPVKAKRSKRFKSFILRMNDSAVIKAPAVGDVSSIDMRVLMRSLVYVECDFRLLSVWILDNVNTYVCHAIQS